MAQPWFNKDFTIKTLEDDYMYDTWAYIHHEKIAPLYIGEWGGHMDGGANQKWMTMLRDYIVQHRLHHAFWCINPNSGDTGGLLGNDWSTWDEKKYGLFKPSLWQNSNGKFIGLDLRVPLGKNGISRGEHFGMSVPTSTPRPTSTPTATPTATPTLTPTATPIPTTQPKVVYGDINSDGKIDSTDYILLRRLVLEIPVSNANLEAADVNLDGAVNTTDCILLRRYLLELINSLPFVG